jgi:hypothetical protein
VSESHSWSSAGTYSVKAKAKDSQGAVSDWSSGFSVNIVANIPPEAHFTMNPQDPVRQQDVFFDASSSSDPDGTIEEYVWESYTKIAGIWIRDNWIGYTSTQTKAFSVGWHAMKVTVHDDSGDTDSYNEEFYVSWS